MAYVKTQYQSRDTTQGKALVSALHVTLVGINLEAEVAFVSVSRTSPVRAKPSQMRTEDSWWHFFFFLDLHPDTPEVTAFRLFRYMTEQILLLG